MSVETPEAMAAEAVAGAVTPLEQAVGFERAHVLIAREALMHLAAVRGIETASLVAHEIAAEFDRLTAR